MSLCNLIGQTADKRLQHVVVSFLPDGALRPRLERAGATVIELAGKRGGAGVFLLRSLGDDIRSVRPDIVQSWMPHANLAAIVMRGLGHFKCPLVWSIRQSVDNPGLDPLLTRTIIRLSGKLSRFPEAIVYNSTNGARTHEAIGYANARRRVIHNGVDTHRFRPRPELRKLFREQLGLDLDAILVGRIGRYSRMKDFDTLLRSFRRLSNVLPSARLLLIGNDISADNRELTTLCRTSGCLDRVEFLGSRLDIELIYPALDVVVSSSSGNEGFPNVVAEALASGALVVSTVLGDGSPLDEGVHRLVPPQNDAALTGAILSLATLPQEEAHRLSRSGRRFIEDNFSMEVFARKHIRLYEELLGTQDPKVTPDVSGAGVSIKSFPILS